jgi:beta-lactam-binding protein with PASTA domain
VPSVIGLTSSAAASQLRSAGFVPVAQSAYNAAAAGTVFAQTPSAGTSLATGSTVRYTVSLGPSSNSTTSGTGTTPAPPPG